MNRLFLLLPAALAGCLPRLPDVSEPCGAWPDPGLFRVEIDRPDSRDRKPYVYVPKSKGPRDVIYLLHGGGSSGPSFEEVTGMEDLADRSGFVVVYPNGLGWPIKRWNAGPEFDPDGDKQDDVAFLDELAATVSPKVCGRRQFAVGFSQGAMMAYRWSCEGDTVEAMGVSSGVPMTPTCDGPPVPTLAFHGLADPIVPYRGGTHRGITSPPVEEGFALVRERNGCTDEQTTEKKGDTTCTAWTCEVPTELCTIEGWGHQWPGGRNASATDANASQRILGFLNASVPLGAGDPTDPAPTAD